jgi:hypothetical protein
MRLARVVRFAICPKGGTTHIGEQSGTSGVQPTLGLTGVTMNAMALIAPGAFLWIT